MQNWALASVVPSARLKLDSWVSQSIHWKQLLPIIQFSCLNESTVLLFLYKAGHVFKTRTKWQLVKSVSFQISLQNSFPQLRISKTGVTLDISTFQLHYFFLVTIFSESGPGQVHVSIAYDIDWKACSRRKKFYTSAAKTKHTCFIVQIIYIHTHTFSLFHFHIFLDAILK